MFSPYGVRSRLYLPVFLAVLVSVLSGHALAAHAGDLSSPPPNLSIPKETQKMESALADLYDASLAAESAAPAPAPQATSGASPPGASGGRTVQVVIEMADAGASPPPGMGIRVETTYGNLVQATVPIQNLGAMASDGSVAFVRLPLKPVAAPDPPTWDPLRTDGHDRGAAAVTTAVAAIPRGAPAAHGTVTTVSEGVARIGADTMHGAGYTGEGLRVAVIDTGFDVTNPEISGNIAEYKSFWFGSTIKGQTPGDIRHGTGSAEIVVDVAPDVALHLYNFDTDVEFPSLVDYIVDRGDIDIVTMSRGWNNWVGPRDGTSMVAQKVAEAADSGILWINSAGNNAKSHWSGWFSDTDGDGFHNFGAADDAIDIEVYAGQTLRVGLTWHGWNSPPQNFDLGLYDDDYNLLASSVNDQHGGFWPHEWVTHYFERDMTAHVAIYNYLADRDVTFHLISSLPLSEYAVPDSSIGAPADSPSSFSVGAYHHSTDTLEDYSSWGPTLDGRVKPDISGPTGVATTAYGPKSYGGTSAAAPHVAGAAALVMQKYPDATADHIRNLLEHTTSNYHAKSNRDGTGRVDLSMFPGSDILALNPGDPACASDGPCFFPQTLGIAPGDTVTWVNAGDSPVRIIIEDGLLDSSYLARGQAYSVFFPANGTFDYADSSYPWASGRVVVGSGVPPPPPDADADGIPDAVDLCPAEPETVNGFRDEDGCPDTPPPPPDPTYSGAWADTVHSITVVTNGSVTGGVPRASDFGVGVMLDPYFAPAGVTSLSGGNATAFTLALPQDRAISSGDTIKIRYDRAANSTSNLAAFPWSNVTNSVHPAPGGLATVPSATAVTLYWDAMADAPADGRYLVQSKPRDAPGGWGAPVDKGASETNHTFVGLSPSTPYDFRAYLANGGGERISDYGAVSTSTTTAAPPPPTAATVTGNVFNDTDRDLLPDDGEPGIPGIEVLVHDYVRGAGDRIRTGADGGYVAANVTFGQTALSQIVLPLPAGHLPTGGIFGLVAYTPLLAVASPTATVDFALYPVPPAELGSITFDVFDDADGDGERDDGEPGVPGATVYTFELLTFVANVQVTGQSGSTVHRNLVPDVVLAQVSYSDPSTGALLLPDGFTRITTQNAGFEYVTVAPGSATAVQIGLGR